MGCSRRSFSVGRVIHTTWRRKPDNLAAVFASRPVFAGVVWIAVPGCVDPVRYSGFENAAAFEGAAEGDFVGVFEVAADGEAAGQSGDL
jgi:hypothetical protein